MKTFTPIFIFATLTMACAIKAVDPVNQTTKDEEQIIQNWITEYKNVTFQHCLWLGYSKSDEILNLLKVDRSTHQDFAFGSIEQYRYIDSIVHPVILRAKMDSTTYYNKFLKGMNEIERDELNGLPMMKYCLAFYVSDELDSIATSRIKQMKYLWQKPK